VADPARSQPDRAERRERAVNALAELLLWYALRRPSPAPANDRTTPER